MFHRNISNQYKLSRSLEALSLATTDSSNQIVFNVGTKRVNINVTQPTADRTYTIPDFGADGSFVLGSSGTNSVNGPVSSTDNAIPRFDGTGGNTLKDSVLTVDNFGSITPTNHISAGVGTIDNAMDKIFCTTLIAGIGVDLYQYGVFTKKKIMIRMDTEPATDIIVYLPSVADTLVARTTTDTLTNKTISSAAFSGTQTGTITHSGQYSNTNTTESSSTSTGAIVTTGGLGVAKNIRCGSGLYLPTTGGTASQLNYYEEYGELVSFTGPISGNMWINFTRIGKAIFFHYDSLYGTSTSAVKFTGTITETRFRPNYSIAFVVYGQDNSDNASLVLNITNTGTITFGVGPSDSNFTGSGGCAVWESCVCYTKN